jgi:hypothetical protein
MIFKKLRDFIKKEKTPEEKAVEKKQNECQHDFTKCTFKVDGNAGIIGMLFGEIRALHVEEEVLICKRCEKIIYPVEFE